ncbi:hypothetical protein [Rubellicoccus peritrichatus]|uniref:Tetratricopeptide repeat protein n=1 Tax=Rubellicoccus peritrichatus TaxID=3080537 RepID=A0AAQ3QRT0_9BACT|nr:hypothetical protein [Puniceicoccus sp. CR14]WOO41603.1 hypothetical protein RZN69_00780 [Puniceicoccus sp. CR14]
MRKLSLVCTLILVFLSSAYGQDGTDYFKQYGNKPIPVTNRTGGADTKLFLVGEDRGDLIFRYNMNDNREIGVPLDTEGLLLYYMAPKKLLEAMQAIDLEDFEVAVQGMRSGIYPLIPYLEIPQNRFNIHPYVERFAYALINSEGNDDETVAFFQRIPLTKLSPVFSTYAIQLVERLVEQKKNREAMALLDKLPLTGEGSILPRILYFANSLRKDGNIEEALFLYQRIQQVKGTPEAEKSVLWIAYCNVELDRLESARLFLEQAGDIKPGETGYSLKQLIQGKILLIEEQPIAAMAQISRGVVYTDVGSDWAPEITYTAGYCYEILEKPDTAREIYGEVLLFYPKTMWGEKSKTQLDALPPKSVPKPTETDTEPS